MPPALRAAPLFASLLLASSACITAGGPQAGPDRASFGHLAVVADPPARSTQVIYQVDFLVEDKRIAEAQPGNAAGFAFTREADGCLRGQQLQEYCPAAPLEGDPPGAQRWRATRTQRTFTTQLNESGDALTVDYLRLRATYRLSSGAAVDEVRREPWMLGIAFASRAFPEVLARADGDQVDFHFNVVEAP